MAIKSNPEWRVENFIAHNKCGVDGYNYRIINNYDQVIDCWCRGSKNQVKQRALAYCDNLNKRDKIVTKENVKMKTCSMGYS